MSRNIEALKRIAAQAASQCRVSFTQFRRDWGLEDFFIDHFDEDRSPHETAAQALLELTQGDLLKRDQIVCLTVVEFLEETAGAIDETAKKRSLGDLKQILRAPRTYEAFLQWARAWYP